MYNMVKNSLGLDLASLCSILASLQDKDILVIKNYNIDHYKCNNYGYNLVSFVKTKYQTSLRHYDVQF